MARQRQYVRLAGKLAVRRCPSTWAQISYNQQFGENIWKAQSGLSRMTAGNQAGNWLDVTVGADVLLNPHMAAYAAFSQAENSATDSDYLYTLG